MKPGQQLKDRAGITVALYPSPGIALSQGVNTGTHLGNWAWDETVDGKPTSSPIYAPGNMIAVEKIGSGAVAFNSIDQEHLADGSIDYFCMRMVHDNNISDIQVGQIFPQGSKIYDEGNAGFATGNHVHMEVARGRYAGLSLTSQNFYKLKNSVEPWKILFLNDTTRIRDLGYPWQLFAEAAVPALKYSMGERLLLTGTIYRNSLKTGPGNSYTQKAVIIDLMVTSHEVPAPYHVSAIGWVSEDELSPIPVLVPCYPVPSYKGGSIVDALKNIGVSSLPAYRKKIAEANGIQNYTATAAQNIALLELLKKGGLKRI